MPVTPSQVRFVDPFADIYSDKVNKRLISIFPNGKGVLYGVHGEVGSSPNLLRLTYGCILKDYVTIFLPNENNLDVGLLADGDYYAVLIYQYHVVQPPPVALLDIIGISDYDPNKHVRICCVTVHNGEVSNVSEQCGTCRDCNPLLDVIMDVLESGINSDLDMNGYRIIHLGDPVADHDGVNKHYLDDRLDFIVKVNDNDQYPNYLGNKLVAGDHITLTIDEFGPVPQDLQIKIDATDANIKITSGDDTKSYI